MDKHDFSLRALYEAIDERRRERDLSWSAVAQEISRSPTKRGSASTITGLRERQVAEGDGVLSMLHWLGRTPESFVPDVVDGNSDRFRLPVVPEHKILRWDAKALYEAIDEQRQKRQLTWTQVALEVGGLTPEMITHLSKGGRVSIPPVMRLIRWLDRSAASFTRLSDW